MSTTKGSIIILIYNSKFLLILRDDIPTISDPNKWTFLGGRKEANESFLETIIRETEEEIGIRIDRPTHFTNLRYDDREKEVYYGSLSDDDVKRIELTEGQKYDFFSLDQVDKLELTRSSRLLLENYKDEIKELM